MKRIEGVERTDVAAGKAEICFPPHRVSKAFVERAIEDSGYPIHRKAPRKGFFGRFIDRLIVSNDKNFGKGRLDCCNLPSSKASRPVPPKG